MTNVGFATLSVIPSARGFGAALSRSVNPQLTGAGSDGGQKFGSGMLASVKKFAGPLAAALSVGAGVAFFKDTISQASGLNESINALNVSYGGASEGVQALGKEAATSLGLSNLEFNNLAVRFSSFSKTIAGEGGNVTGTLDDLTTRASDFASVMNLDVAEAAQLFQSGLAGESEPLRRFGLDMSAAAVEAYGLANGMSANGKSLTEAEKVQARYGLLMQQTSATQGDFANTSDQLANQQRILGARFDDLKANIGARLLPVITNVVSFLNDNMQPTFESVSGGVRSFAAAFTERVLPVLRSVGGYITGTVVPALASLVGWLKENQAWLMPIAVGVGAMVVAFQAFQVVLAVVRIATAAYAVVQGVLNAVMSANPIGLVVLAIVGLVAALVYAWNNSETFRNIVTGVWEAIKTAVSAVADWFTVTIPALWDSIVQWTTEKWNGILDFFRAIPGRVVDFFMNWTLIGLLIQHWDTIKEGAVTGFTAVVDWIRGVPGLISDAVGDLGDLLYDAGAAVITGLWDGMKSIWGNVTGWVSDAGDAISNGFKSVLGIASPSKVFASHGANIMLGLQGGLEAALPGLERTLAGVSATVAGTRLVATGGIASPDFGGRNVNGGAGGGAPAIYVQNPFTGEYLLAAVDQRAAGVIASTERHQAAMQHTRGSTW